jgi:hypothetical protein
LVVTVDEVVHITDSTAAAISISATGGTPPYTYVWSGPSGFMSNSEDISGMDEGLYSIVVTDAHGCTTSIADVEVRDETVGLSDLQTLEVRMYPNPAGDLVHLDIEDARAFAVQLYTLQGQMIQHVVNTNVVSVKGRAPGIYILKITSEGKQFVGRLGVIR